MRDDIGFRSSGLVFSGVTWGNIEGIYRGYIRDYRGDYYRATKRHELLKTMSPCGNGLPVDSFTAHS